MADDQTAERPVGGLAETRSVTLVDIHVGRRLRAQRLLKGLTQEQLAAHLGVTFQQVQKYENGGNRVSVSRLYHAAQILQVPILWFFEGLAGVERDDRTTAEDRMSFNNPEVLRFVHAVSRISDPDRRRLFRELAAALANANDE